MARLNALRIPLRVVFYKEADDWIAHCLEFDLMGDGMSKAAAVECLAEAIHLQAEASIEAGNIKNLITPADGRYFVMFAQGKDVATGVLEIGVKRIRESSDVIDSVDIREYEDCESDLVLA